MKFSSLFWFMMASARKPVPIFNCSADTCKARLIFSAAEPNSKTCKTIDVHTKLPSRRYRSKIIFRECKEVILMRQRDTSQDGLDCKRKRPITMSMNLKNG